MRLSGAGLLLAGAVAVASAPVRAEDAAVASVRKLYAGFETAMKAGNDPAARADAAARSLGEVFDFPTMTRLAVGPRWKSETPEQHAELTEAFGRYFAALYTMRLSRVAGGSFDVSPESESQGPNRIVHSKVKSGSGEETRVDFVVNPAGRVQDILLTGSVSELAKQRTTFAGPLKAGGAPALLKFLRERTEGLVSAKPTP